MSSVPPDEVLRLYDEGVDGFAGFAGGMTDDDWDRRACGEWSAVAVARHVASVAGWYHEWLDRAEGGDALPPFRPSARMSWPCRTSWPWPQQARPPVRRRWSSS